MWPFEQNPAMFAYKLKFILLPQVIATLNSYACLLTPLVNVNCSAFPECFYRPCKSMTGEMALMEGSSLALRTWYGSHCQYASVWSLYWNNGSLWVHVHIIATVHSTISVILLLCLSFCHHPPQPCIPTTYLLIYAGPIFMNYMLKIGKISHCLLARLVVQKLTDN